MSDGPVYRMNISVNWPSSLFQAIKQTSLPDHPYTAGIRIRIWIHLFTLMRIRVQFTLQCGANLRLLACRLFRPPI